MPPMSQPSHSIELAAAPVAPNANSKCETEVLLTLAGLSIMPASSLYFTVLNR